MYLAYLMSEFRKFTGRMGALILLGVLMAYVANIIRMGIIILTGVYHGPEALYWVHKEIGWMIFLAWVGVFWLISHWILHRKKRGRGRPETAGS
jgi:exosortase/archaeosortase family protein